MTPGNPPLPLGYSPVPPGHLVNVVTCLEMLERPASAPEVRLPASYRLDRLQHPDLAAYRALFRKVGEDWMWYSRLIMPDETLRGILGDPDVHVFVLRDKSRDFGLLELDFRTPNACELAFFGLVPEVIGKGLGRALMQAAIAMAWSRPISRLWVHTCHFDHPQALGFYIRSGFKPYAFQVEMQRDPRLTGHLPPTAAPHVPLLSMGASR